MNKKQKKMLIRIIIAAVMVIVLNFIPTTGILRLALYLAAYLIIGYDILKKAGKGILNRRVFDGSGYCWSVCVGNLFQKRRL